MYIHNGILLSHKKKNKILPFATTWMELECITLNEKSQSEKDILSVKTGPWADVTPQ